MTYHVIKIEYNWSPRFGGFLKETHRRTVSRRKAARWLRKGNLTGVKHVCIITHGNETLFWNPENDTQKKIEADLKEIAEEISHDSH
jgi:hypothetical protein